MGLREKREPEVLILRMRKVVAMDATGLNALEDLFDKALDRVNDVLRSTPKSAPILPQAAEARTDALTVKVE